jgi:hypothetical protein
MTPIRMVPPGHRTRRRTPERTRATRAFQRAESLPDLVAMQWPFVRTPAGPAGRRRLRNVPRDMAFARDAGR